MSDSAEKDVTWINGHRVAFWARWWRCTRCEASLLTLMQFQTRECPGPVTRDLPPADGRP